MFDDDGFGLDDAIAAGSAYAFFRDGQDRQTAQIIDTLDQPGDVLVAAPPAPEPVRPAPNNLDTTTDTILTDWEDYIGQDPLKQQLLVSVTSAQARRVRLPHVLLASGYPGVGKTTMARLLAKTLKVGIVEMVPPFKVESIVAAAMELNDKDILFIDEIHKMTDGVGARGAEVLLKILEDGVAYIDGQLYQLPNITVIGATTDPDKLPEPVVDRFKIKPYFQAYKLPELGMIAMNFTFRHRAEDYVTDELAVAIAKACRGTPRIIETMVESALDLALTYGHKPTPEELLKHIEVEPDGLTRTHIHYLTAMRQYFGREDKDGDVEYIVGEAAIQQILRETKQGIGRVERFLVERGLLNRTSRGRQLTPLGIERAEGFIAEGKGVSDVA